MIRVFPRRTKWTPTDELAFVGAPPLFLPDDQPVRVSVCFTWDIQEGERLVLSWLDHFSDVQLGGPAFGDAGNGFEPGFFLKEGITITSRGCCWKCPWCLVPEREGKVRLLPIRDGYILQDNNILACPREHIERVFEMLRRQSRAIHFNGGLDTRLLKPWHIDLLKTIKVKEIWVACDGQDAIEALERAADLLSDFPERKKRCYAMIGYGDETLHEAELRLDYVYRLGFLPFSQLYQPKKTINYSNTWKQLNRKWSRPAAYKKKTMLLIEDDDGYTD